MYVDEIILFPLDMLRSGSYFDHVVLDLISMSISTNRERLV